MVRADGEYQKKRHQMKFKIPYSELLRPETLKDKLKEAGIEYTRKGDAYYVTEENGKRLQIQILNGRPRLSVKVLERG